MSIWRQLIGSIGSLFAGFCCLGFAPILGFLTTIGVGFLINDNILIPLFIAFLGISLWGLKAGWRCHGNGKVFTAGIIFVLMAITTLWVFPLITYITLIGLVVVSVWDIYLVKRCEIRKG